jgi:hypothetical protein
MTYKLVAGDRFGDYLTVERTADRKICVPYDVIHADFDLRAVA